MQASKKQKVNPRLRPLKPAELRVIERFMKKLGINLGEPPENLMALETPKARYVDVFSVPEGVKELLKHFQAHYSAGLYLGYIEKGRFKPGLPLARKLAGNCGKTIKCIKLDEEGEKRFLYRRIVKQENIIEWHEGVTVVVNRQGEPIGWGRGVVEGGAKTVKPLKDLGWYLRRGG